MLGSATREPRLSATHRFALPRLLDGEISLPRQQNAITLGRLMSLTSTQKEQAYALALGVERGLVTFEETVQWADALLVAMPMPNPELIEVSATPARSPLDIVMPLRALGVDADCTASVRRLLTHLHLKFRQQPDSLPLITAALERLALDGLAPNDETAQIMSQLDDARQLAEAGIYGTIDEVARALDQFLSDESSGELIDAPPVLDSSSVP